MGPCMYVWSVDDADACTIVLVAEMDPLGMLSDTRRNLKAY